jgi:orotidine-5'-phosphate decarboxylase
MQETLPNLIPGSERPSQNSPSEALKPDAQESGSQASDFHKNSPRERLIVALDVSSATAAQKIVAAVGDSALTYKVGMQLYTAEGPRVVRDLVEAGRKVFLDLKYHDIPNTVASAVREAAQLGVSMMTVHASGSEKMLRAAVDAARVVNPELIVLAVTVLTSMGQDDLEKIGIPEPLVDEVLRLAGLALKCGCQGIVASAREAAVVRRLGQGFAIVTPGVRPAGAGHADQVRVVTPAEAIAAGATHIVVGRPITEAEDPAAAAKEILKEML